MTARHSGKAAGFASTEASSSALPFAIRHSPFATGMLVLTLLAQGASICQETANLVGNGGASLSVDSTFPGYDRKVLNDGKWVAPGEEVTADYGSPDRLGNCGNTWVSGVGAAEHWVRLDWPRAVEVSRVVVWWAIQEWHSGAFRVEYLSDESWVPVSCVGTWLEATERRSLVSFPPREVQALRVVQHPAGGPERGFLALQEVLAYGGVEGEESVEGARVLTDREVAALAPMGLQRNIARLDETQPGGSRPVVYFGDRSEECPSLADGGRARAYVAGDATAIGVEWPIQHVIDGAAVYLERGAKPPPKAALIAEVHDGRRWVEVTKGLSVAADDGGRVVRFAWRPLATKAFRVRDRHGVGERSIPRVAELEVFRYIPKSPNEWPPHLTELDGFGQEVLTSGAEPSYELLASQALSMRPAKALLGLKDLPKEVGVTWDGRIIAAVTLDLALGEARETLADYRDTVTRTLLDGWRPATIVRGRLGEVALEETAFVGFAGPARTRPALFVRVRVTNVGDTPLDDVLAVRTGTQGEVQRRAFIRDGNVALVADPPPRPGDEAGELVFRLRLAPGKRGTVDLVHPHTDTVAFGEVDAYPLVRFDEALREFRRYWDAMLEPAAHIEVPEPHANNMYRAILAQLLINGDNEVMPYGADPGVYSGNLYGLEEGFAMLALASLGYQADAQRYLDGTYLTHEFLKKVPRYETYPDRHQQYRNGLQPHYAVTAYRLSRDRDWIEKHLDLIRECAEWTIEQRRATMQLANGEQPLHWGLLPKWSYGGDIAGLQCYALYANFACWRGLRDTAWLLGQLGDTEAAERYRGEAADYRQAIDRAVEGNYRADHDPPFLPLRLYADEPVGDDYYQLFSGALLDLLPFQPGSRHEAYITDYLEQDNLLFCGLPRFRRDVGAGGIDGLYGLGYVLGKLHQDRINEFLLGFYGYLAYNLERDTFAARETNLLYASDLHVRSAYPVPDMSDPVPCSAAVALQYLRNMLVTEEIGGDGMPSGDLLVLYGTPRAWFGNGQRICVEGAPTDYGPMSVRVVSRAAKGRIEAVVEPPTRDRWGQIQLRLRHPEGKHWRKVLVNGQQWNEVDAERELVVLRPGKKQYRIAAAY